MDQKERSADFTAALKVAFDGRMREVWTSLPGIVDSYNAADNTVTVRPAIKATVLVLDPKTGKQTPTETEITNLIKVPFHQTSGGNFVIDVVPAQGDEVTVLFSARNIDGWWQSGGVQSQVEQRMHDLSDGIAIPGLFSAPRAADYGLGAGGLRIRQKDNAASLHLPGDGTIVLTATTVIINADIQTTGTISNNGTIIDSTHIHTKVTPGGGLSGPPQ